MGSPFDRYRAARWGREGHLCKPVFIDSGAFLVGGDGLHSATREVLFEGEPITFLGLALVPCALFPIHDYGVSVAPVLNSTCIFKRAASVLR